ncbi:MAG: hypothetical protein K0S41_4117 [Anaerocolumna sp.]|jgi:hypothetical protein|nr:hypothetical protein [Anaerocolumna sp.]
MINLEGLLYNKVKSVIDTWVEDDIYAISFFVYSNELNSYKRFSNVTDFMISYNTEKDCDGAELLSEERWNYAFWRQNITYIINTNQNDEMTKALFGWYSENGIKNIGYEDVSCIYDENMYYIGKGPVGYYELLCLVSEVAKRLQLEGFIKQKFGKSIPIIIHDLEYAWYSFEATKNGNPNQEADSFFTAMKEMGFILS